MGHLLVLPTDRARLWNPRINAARLPCTVRETAEGLAGIAPPASHYMEVWRSRRPVVRFLGGNRQSPLRAAPPTVYSSMSARAGSGGFERTSGDATERQRDLSGDCPKGARRQL